MTVNREMFAEIYGLITEFPELHHPGSWESDPAHTGNCGTTRCIAGWATWIAARDHGLLTRKRQMTDQPVREELTAKLGLDRATLGDGWYYKEHAVSEYPSIGGYLLGLDDDQAHSLFHDMNDERVMARVKSYADTGEDISDELYNDFEAED